MTDNQTNYHLKVDIKTTTGELMKERLLELIREIEKGNKPIQGVYSEIGSEIMVITNKWNGNRY